ncbi:acyltransferase family protein [Chondrinema litorale]|uniref:acyltransferase family protein n=1 Tax=Chondrinema litorale TaxID=2994555 RepID=UPI00254385B4|nr:acyltransferase [Chondrinema litorale]UZS00132.1 acyltransferase [Chondrinema litorale]
MNKSSKNIKNYSSINSIIKYLLIVKVNLDNRIFGLDIIRAIAIVLVLLAHSIFLLYPLSGILKYKLLHLFGFPAVELFFVLSGFLIGRILIKKYVTKTNFDFFDIKDFWIRRWFRTLPNYYLVLIFNYLLFYFINRNIYPNWKYIFFIQNFATPHPFFFGEAWSLAIEEWFYILIPLMLIFFDKFLLKLLYFNKRKVILLFIVIFILAGTCLRIHFVFHNETFIWDENIRKVVIYRLDTIMYGVLLAYFHQFHNHVLEVNRKKLFIIGTILILYSMIILYSIIKSENPNIFNSIFIFSIFNIGTALIIPYIAKIKTSKSIWTYLITHISIISYSIYLIHNSLIFTIQNNCFKPNNMFETIIGYILYWFITIIISTLLFNFFEKPLTDLREKFS